VPGQLDSAARRRSRDAAGRLRARRRRFVAFGSVGQRLPIELVVGHLRRRLQRGQFLQHLRRRLGLAEQHVFHRRMRQAHLLVVLRVRMHIARMQRGQPGGGEFELLVDQLREAAFGGRGSGSRGRGVQSGPPSMRDTATILRPNAAQCQWGGTGRAIGHFQESIRTSTRTLPTLRSRLCAAFEESRGTR
jgi:hypothetical protein